MLIKRFAEDEQTIDQLDVADEITFKVVTSPVRYADVELSLGDYRIDVSVAELRQMHAAIEAALAEVDAIAAVTA